MQGTAIIYNLLLLSLVLKITGKKGKIESLETLGKH